MEEEFFRCVEFIVSHEEDFREKLECFLQNKPFPSLRLSGSSSSLGEATPQGHFQMQQAIASPSAIVSPSLMGNVMQSHLIQMRETKRKFDATWGSKDDLVNLVVHYQTLLWEKERKTDELEKEVKVLDQLRRNPADDREETIEMNKRLLEDAKKKLQEQEIELCQLRREISQVVPSKMQQITWNTQEVQETLINLLAEQHEFQKERARLNNQILCVRDNTEYAEEKLAIAEGKLSVLEDQLAKMKESTEPGAGMEDVWQQIEELKQEVASLRAQRSKLQETEADIKGELHLLESILPANWQETGEDMLQLADRMDKLFDALNELCVDMKKLLEDTQKGCLVCGDKASGTQLTVQTCEACRKFFQRGRRSICKANNECVVTKSTRKDCPACRFNKCLRVGVAKKGASGNVAQPGTFPSIQESLQMMLEMCARKQQLLRVVAAVLRAEEPYGEHLTTGTEEESLSASERDQPPVAGASGNVGQSGTFSSSQASLQMMLEIVRDQQERFNSAKARLGGIITGQQSMQAEIQGIKIELQATKAMLQELDV
ncbi:uncharacterized protein LOC125446000 [Sphaerodactylus townsendi]|uniref:uncharacterized protein LOC125446000 n=1 Tax=Sphaerodactylus townsendi TaxID=933632 RepID=UPI0020271F87|nr:uncharacterized protein LOC125446000 [Sphaerodactylus townsendi]